jgi:hypothetical protein
MSSQALWTEKALKEKYPSCFVEHRCEFLKYKQRFSLCRKCKFGYQKTLDFYCQSRLVEYF